VTRKGAFGAAEYRVNGTLVDPDRMLHLRAFGPRPGSVMGMNPIEYARTTIGLGLAVRDFGATWYESGGHPTSLLTTEQDVDDADALAAKEKFRQATTADHIAVMGNGWDLKSVQVAPDDALFLAASNASGIDICGYHGIPPEMLGYATAGGSVTYANREQRAIDLLTWTVQWWIGRMERLITRQLPPTRYVKISVDGLLRSDALTRWTVHDKAVRLGARNVDEVRALEDELPIPGEAGQPYLWPPAGATLPPEVEDPAEKAKENENLTGPMATGGTND
jgi:HK97 family phage portal protein